MPNLIPLHQQTIGNETVQTVNAHDLYTFLEVKTQYSDWIARRIKSYSFVQDIDFTVLISGYGPTKTMEYHLTFDMAKELSMVERTKKGKEARQYFLECERVALQTQPTPHAVTPGQVALALAQAQVALEQRQLAIEARQDAQDEKLQTILDRQPPAGKLRPGDWLRRHSKPHLSPDLMKSLNAHCRSLEAAEYWRPDGYDWMVPYHSPDIISQAYDEVTRQLSFIHDPGVPYQVRKRGRQ